MDLACGRVNQQLSAGERGLQLQIANQGLVDGRSLKATVSSVVRPAVLLPRRRRGSSAGGPDPEPGDSPSAR